MKHQDIDLSEETLILRHRNGVCLARPDQVGSCNSIPQNDIAVTYRQILYTKELNFYIMDHDNAVRALNETMDQLLQIGYTKPALNKNVKKLVGPKSYEIIKNNNHFVTDNEALFLNEENLINPIGDPVANFLSLKLPLYTREDELCGIFGFSMAIGVQNLGAGIQKLLEYGFLNQSNSFLKTQSSYLKSETILSSKQIRILKYLSHGYTSKYIGLALNISPRTVEKHIENIKNKLNIHCKNGLIEFFLKSNIST